MPGSGQKKIWGVFVVWALFLLVKKRFIIECLVSILKIGSMIVAFGFGRSF